MGDIKDLTVVPCPHTSITNGTCDYCNKTGIVAAVNDKLYENFAAAQSAWLADGGTLKLYQNVSGMTSTTWEGTGTNAYTLDRSRQDLCAKLFAGSGRPEVSRQ